MLGQVKQEDNSSEYNKPPGNYLHKLTIFLRLSSLLDNSHNMWSLFTLKKKNNAK